MLTDHERQRFMEYLEELVRTNRQLVGQLNELNIKTGTTNRIADVLEIEARAADIIARRLKETESETTHDGR